MLTHLCRAEFVQDGRRQPLSAGCVSVLVRSCVEYAFGQRLQRAAETAQRHIDGVVFDQCCTQRGHRDDGRSSWRIAVYAATDGRKRNAVQRMAAQKMQCVAIALREQRALACAGSAKPCVMRASPVGQRTPGVTCGSARQARSSSGPAARWMAPSTPPPPSNVSFAALTMASTRNSVMSAVMADIGMVSLRVEPYPAHG